MPRKQSNKDKPAKPVAAVQEKRARGRPRKIESPEDMERMIGEYVTKRENEKIPLTLTGALNYMGIYSRATLGEYDKRQGFSEPVKKLRGIIADAYEQRLHGSNPTGAIFALKNMGWSDRQEVEMTGKGGGPVRYADMSADEVNRRLAELEGKLGTDGGGKG